MKKPPTPPEKICRQMSRKYFQSNPPDLKEKEEKRGVGGINRLFTFLQRPIHLLVLYIGYASKGKTTTLILET
jgi:hypothetical protein